MHLYMVWLTALKIQNYEWDSVSSPAQETGNPVQ